MTFSGPRVFAGVTKARVSERILLVKVPSKYTHWCAYQRKPERDWRPRDPGAGRQSEDRGRDRIMLSQAKVHAGPAAKGRGQALPWGLPLGRALPAPEFCLPALGSLRGHISVVLKPPRLW